MDEREQLEQAIAAQENLRGIVADAVVDAAVASLRAQLAELEARSAPSLKQRKQVTVLFADVSGSTAMAETMDAEEVSDVFDLLWRRMDAAITESNGRIDKHIGDAVMALWGADRAREDDPEQAVRAALAMQAAIGEPHPAFGGRPLPLSLRIGINTGPVVLGEVGSRSEFTAMGDTVNVASRLESNAPVGGVLISHDTYQHIRGLFTVHEQAPLTVKGKSEPLRTYVVEGVRPRAFHPGTRGIEGIEIPMIGRDAELGRLQDAFADVTDRRRFKLVTLVGEAGVGKSRLLVEFDHWLRSRARNHGVFRGRAEEQRRGVSNALVRDLFFFHCGITDNDPDPVAMDKLETVVIEALGATHRQKCHFVGHLIGLDAGDYRAVSGIQDDAEQLRDRAFNSVGEFFTAASQARPVVILLEDIHWADHGSLDLVAHLTDHCEQSGVLVVGTTRPSLYEHRPGWDETVDIRLDLSPLGGRHGAELVRHALQNLPVVPDAVRAAILRHSEGNPLYIEELVKMMIDSGVIDADGDDWRLAPDRLGELSVPPTLTRLIQARLDALSRYEREVLQRAAVVGRTFWSAALAHSLGHQSPAETGPVASNEQSTGPFELPAVLDALARREFVLAQDQSAFAGSQEFMFKHAIAHDVAYETVLKRFRRDYHRQAAEWLESQSAGRAHAALIARHYEIAGVAAAAARWHAAAGKHAQDRYANDDAVAHYRAALEAGTLTAPDLIPVQRGLGDVLWLQGRYDRAADAYRSMRAAAEEAGDVNATARAWTLLASAEFYEGDVHAALASAETAERLLQDADGADTAERAYAAWATGFYRFGMGEADAALARAEEALALSTSAGDRQTAARSSGLVGLAHLARGDYDEGTRALEAALSIDRELGDRRGEATRLNNLGLAASERGDFEAAASRYGEALAVIRETGDSREAICLLNSGAVAVAAGDFRAALRHLVEAYEVMGDMGRSDVVSALHRYLAEAYLGAGETDHVLEHAWRALEYAGADLEDVGLAWRALGLVAAASGPVAERAGSAATWDVEACFAKAVDCLSRAGRRRHEALAKRDWARVELTSGDRARGAALWQEARDTLVSMGLTLLVDRMDTEREPPRPQGQD